MYDSIYKEAFNVRTVQDGPGPAGPAQGEWKAAPAAAAANPAPQHLSPRAKAGLVAGAAALVVTGAFTWTTYTEAQAKADVQKAQIALEQQKLDLQKAQQAADLAKSAGQETDAQKARRLAVSDCVAKAGGGFNAVADCGNAFPAVETLGGTQTVSQTVPHGTNDSTVPVPGAVVLGGVAVLIGFGWVKKRLPRRM